MWCVRQGHSHCKQVLAWFFEYGLAHASVDIGLNEELTIVTAYEQIIEAHRTSGISKEPLGTELHLGKVTAFYIFFDALTKAILPVCHVGTVVPTKPE